jgi:hypothetical protein
MSDDIDELLSEETNVPMSFAGIAPANTPKPAFRLMKMLPRKRMVTKAVKEESGFVFQRVEEEVEGGYMLHAYKGHSIFIESLAALKAQGLDKYVPMLAGADHEEVMRVPTAMVTTKATKAT